MSGNGSGGQLKSAPSADQPRHKAQTIKLPIATKTTGKNHLSMIFCMRDLAF